MKLNKLPTAFYFLGAITSSINTSSCLVQGFITEYTGRATKSIVLDIRGTTSSPLTKTRPFISAEQIISSSTHYHQTYSVSELFASSHPLGDEEEKIFTESEKVAPGDAAGKTAEQEKGGEQEDFKCSYAGFFSPPTRDDVSFLDRKAGFKGEEEQDQHADINFEDIEFDLIVIGSGNGACGFLSHTLKGLKQGSKVLVLEQGQNFFYTSDVTHQNNWSRIYSTGTIYKLHNARTSRGRPIISGRACTMGGGGSINYTMIHESSKWLSEKVGHPPEYWDHLKLKLNKQFHRPSPVTTQTKFSSYIQERALDPGPEDHPRIPMEPPKEYQYVCSIPNLQDNFSDYPTKEAKQFYIFPTQFNAYGQRTNSGVSIVDWDKVNLRCNREVQELVMEGQSCTKVKVKNGLTKKNEVYKVKKGGKVILASGSQSPRLLMSTTPEIKNDKLGKHVNDHICLPLGIYIVPENLKATVGGGDAYEPVFGTTVVNTSDFGQQSENSVKEVVTLDFFTGSLERLSFLASSLYLCFIPFNSLKRLMARYPLLFTLLSNTIRVLLTVVVFVFDVITFKFLNESNELKITTSLIKFKAVREGQYETENNQITLKFFEDANDFIIAEEAIKENLAFLESIGHKPNFLIRKFFQLITRIPYEEDEVKSYVKRFSKRTLLSEQHLAGGCVFGEAIDKGLTNASDTGKVFGTENIHVADLSAVPLPRCSTQMTAYLVGYHVGTQMYPLEE